MSENTTVDQTTTESQGEASAVGDYWRRVVYWLAGLNGLAIMLGGLALGLVTEVLGLSEWVSTPLFLVGGLFPILQTTLPSENGGYDHEISNLGRLKLTGAMLLWMITPMAIVTQVFQTAGNFVPYARYVGRLPNRDRHVPDTDLTAPFDGEWTAVNGGVTQETSHSWFLVSQRYAYDFVVTDDDGDTHAGDGDALDEYYAFGKPIQAPAGGTVVATEDSLRDYPTPGSFWPEWRTYKITGNYVVIEHNDGEYSMLAHLKQGSVTVEPGDTVARGDVIGRCGNSGNSSEPHLHYQIMDRSNFWVAAGLVPRFRAVSVSREDTGRDGHEVYEPVDAATERRYLWAGDRIRPARAADRPAGQATPTDS